MMALRPIIVDSEGMILGGNMRFKALKELGYKDVPDEWVKRDSELTEAEKQRFIIADNIGFGEYDWDLLANEWDKDDLIDWGLDVIDLLEKVKVEENEDDIPDINEQIVKQGDLTFNRTNVELKCQFREVLSVLYLSFNRTNVELKLTYRRITFIFFITFNRTNVELK